MDLVIVESPAKARTIEAYLGGSARVLASYGHVRDLPQKDGSVDPAQDFAMRWEVGDKRAREQVRAITEAARGADRVILATDPDREGEAISWHLAEILRQKKAVPAGGLKRISFNAITKDQVLRAMASPRDIDQPLVEAYLARRALDYLVGFTLSPVLWRRLPGARSAGRVQSVALRLIVEREREIEAHRVEDYWSVEAMLRREGDMAFKARLVMLDGRKLERMSLRSAEVAEAARARVAAAGFEVASVETRAMSRHPQPPFTTSTLQQEAARKLGLSARDTMSAAQRLYEAGHITYMRTDGVDMAPDAVAGARDMVMERYGRDYLPERPRRYQTKAKNAQEAHEAIRPVDFARLGRAIGADGVEAKLYELIWKRAVASQMASAELERTAVELVSGDGTLGLRATGTVTLFAGFLALYAEGQDDAADGEEGDRLPRLGVGDRADVEAAEARHHQTQPPPRFSEASLVKRLEELGIGRPSTYASIIQTLKDRDYVRLEAKRFRPEDKGRIVTAFLERFFGRYVEYDYTAGLEERLDEISAGELDWLAVLRDFWGDFKPLTDAVLGTSPKEIEAALDEHLGPALFPPGEDGTDGRACPRCADGRLALKVGRYGPYIACSAYPECRYRRRFGEAGDEEVGTHPETGEAIALKTGQYGRYLQMGAQRVSAPEALGAIDLELALRLLSLPRELGAHPETGEPVVATMGSKGPYLKSGERYARLDGLDELFAIGMNAAVVKLAEAPVRGAGGPRRASEPLAELGTDPASGRDVRVMPGRYGAYVTDGKVNATIPKTADPQAVTLEEAVAWLAAKAAKGSGARGGRKGGTARQAQTAGSAGGRARARKAAS